MSPQYLLDTNVLSDFVRGDAGVTKRLRARTPDQIAISSVTVMEVVYGLTLAPERASRLRPAIEGMLAAVSLLPFEASDARAAGALRAALKRRGRPIGAYDILIAGSALARGLTLVTANVAEFSRVDGLLLENWRN